MSNQLSSLFKDNKSFSEVIVIGCGGAGLSAAIEIKKSGGKVIVLGKRNKFDAHTTLAAGGINAAFGNVDKLDSWEQHFADTFIEGYGIADPEAVEILAKESPYYVKQLDEWGANFAKLKNGKLDQRYFGAHTFRRTCYTGDYTGRSILQTLINKAESLNIPILDNFYVTDLLVKDNKCFGNIALNINTLEIFTFFGKSVILCSGGHTRLWKSSSSRDKENTGDGYELALKAGAKLIDMEMVQFHPTGMLFPKEMEGTLVTEAVRGEGGILLNSLGERFMKNYDEDRLELSTRDRVAVANYTEIKQGRVSPNGGVFLDISHKSKEEILNKLPDIYKQFLDYQNLDISKEPMEVAPTAHYSMGGIKVEAHEHSTNIKGLYAAGEVAGGLHGANRLGGNSLAEIIIFGSRAGIAAFKYSRSLEKDYHDEQVTNNAIKKIKNLLSIRNNKSNNIKYLQDSLRENMWLNCGVIKCEQDMLEGLENISMLEDKLKKIDISSKDDLLNFLDFSSSLITAKATIMSAIVREESRGSHQRSDFKESKKIYNCNFEVTLKGEKMIIEKRNLIPIKKDLKIFIENTKSILDLKGRLLE